ncbi:aldo/keto reductase [Kaistia geumhonensis]|uniref:Dehydrogenase/aryl-alcohol dehydrogenase-like putative oxidoreductase n=1 Tax=Kaistia geumhonensis TaxID=410839 RepID=A0ABU0M325_9HYPH|nr:aldo/keto reductase [Kaistia geumhonensis]MCX5479447.1 aldo/keto reductase [Kaistia geumhonensis]MDQ0515330.1 putative dehydrogenase/aryl-alcohol dehydrogenase-like putative oxidoreductase [Kaistia geumhonensis]
MTSQPLRWGIIGPGGIARAFADGVAHSRTGKLVAIATRDPQKPGLADAFPGARIIEGYDAMLADPEVEAIYIATPHPSHAEWAIKAAEAGKHVLVEKPLALTAFEADAVFHAARKAGTFAGEAFMYRLHPQTAKLVELVKAGTIGEVRAIKSSFGFAMPRFDASHRLYANELAGGGILDVGCYPVSMSRLIAGAASGKPFAEPEQVFGIGHLGKSGVDEWASALLKFPGDILAEVSCSVSLAQDNVLRILGTTGRIEVKDFWFAGGREGGTGVISIHRPDGSVETVEVAEPGWLYSFEADAAGEAIRAGKTEFATPGMSWADTLGNLAVLDKWRAAIGLEYDIEKAANRPRTVAGRVIAKRPAGIPKRALPGVARDTSLVALGFEFFPNFSGASILLDAFFEAGGNLFDTAFIYGGGKTEALFGEWQTSRGIARDDFVVIGKGAHSPLVYPDIIAKQLTQTLDRLKTDYVDVYFMHRDNPEIPVGEFVDAMDAEVKAGRIRGPYGGSNWTRERLDAAIAYADKTGKTRPGALSNNFSLAEMVDPIWAGCVHASDDEWKSWLKERQIPNFAWSSQGRGFFTDRAGRGKMDDAEIVRCWYSEKNFDRRDRAIELAGKLGRSPIHVALAYVLAQPFPVVPLIGPRTLAELEDSLSALDIRLTPDQIAWLDNG